MVFDMHLTIDEQSVQLVDTIASTVAGSEERQEGSDTSASVVLVQRAQDVIEDRSGGVDGLAEVNIDARKVAGAILFQIPRHALLDPHMHAADACLASPSNSDRIDVARDDVLGLHTVATQEVVVAQLPRCND